jgi:serine/threonine protein kinase
MTREYQQQQHQQPRGNGGGATTTTTTTTTSPSSTRLRKSKSLSNLLQQQTVIRKNDEDEDEDEERRKEEREHKIRESSSNNNKEEEEEEKTRDDDFLERERGERTNEEDGEKPMKRVASMKAMMHGREEEEEEEEEYAAQQQQQQQQQRAEEDFFVAGETTRTTSSGSSGRKRTPPGSPLRRTNTSAKLRGGVVAGLRKTATIHSHASVLDLMQMGETREEEDRAGRLLGQLQISSREEEEAAKAERRRREEIEGGETTTTTTTANKEDDSNLVSAAGLSKDYKEAEYDDSLREIIVPPSSSFPKDFTVLRELGKGLCGTVYLARLHDTKQLLAFKVMRKSKLVSVGEEKHAAYERHVHMDVSNGPFIASLFHSYDDPTAYYLLTEYAPCGDLFQCLVYHGLPSLSDAKVYISQVSAAIAYLHVKKYVYRDLKPENILLRANGDACLADFGMAKKLEREDERAYSFCGTSQYMSPEVMSKRGCRFEADLWSLGVLIYELCSGATPYANIRGNHMELYEAVLSVDMNGGVWCPHWFDADTVDIVRKLLRLDELARLGAGGGDAMDAYFSHPWFHNGDFKCDLKNVLRGEVTPRLKPRKRNIVYDLRLQNQLELGNVPWLASDESEEKFVNV